MDGLWPLVDDGTVCCRVIRPPAYARPGLAIETQDGPDHLRHAPARTPPTERTLPPGFPSLSRDDHFISEMMMQVSSSSPSRATSPQVTPPPLLNASCTRGLASAHATTPSKAPPLPLDYPR
jgi:hypothetical protein